MQACLFRRLPGALMPGKSSRGSPPSPLPAVSRPYPITLPNLRRPGGLVFLPLLMEEGVLPFVDGIM